MPAKFDAHLLKTETIFVAEDPWHGNRRDTFHLDYYVLVAPGTVVRPNSRPTGYYRRGIQAQLCGVRRALPDSLYNLWRAGRVPAEALPRLLHEMELGLKETDYGMLLGDKGFAVLVWTFLVLFGLATTATLAAAAGAVLSGVPLWVALVIAPFFVVPLSAGLRKVWQMRHRKLAQTNAILARL